MITGITSYDDRKWLCETHLKHIQPPVRPESFVCAMLHGNESGPNTVELFKKNHYRCIPTVYTEVAGVLRLNEVRSRYAGTLRARTKLEKEAGSL